MDIYCPTCTEPWDNDSLHEEASASGRTYAAVAADFCRQGCKALGEAFGPQPHCQASIPDERVAAVYGLLGDDMDGAAAMLEDLRGQGL